MVILKNSVLFDAFGTYQAADMRSLMYTITHPPKYHAVYGLHDMEVVCDTENENNVLVCNGTFSIAETTVPYVGRSEDVVSVSLPEPPTQGERYDYVIIEHIGQDVYVRYEVEPNESQLLLAIVKRYADKSFVGIEDIYDQRQIVLTPIVLPETETLIAIIQECITEYTIRPDQLLSGELYNDVVLRVADNKENKRLFLDGIRGGRDDTQDVNISKGKKSIVVPEIPLNYDILKYVINKLLMISKFPIENIIASEMLPDTMWVKQYDKRYVSIDSAQGIRTTNVNPYVPPPPYPELPGSFPDPVLLPVELPNNIQELKEIVDTVVSKEPIVGHQICSGMLDEEFELVINRGNERDIPKKPPEKKPPKKDPPPEKKPPKKPPKEPKKPKPIVDWRDEHYTIPPVQVWGMSSHQYDHLWKGWCKKFVFPEEGLYNVEYDIEGYFDLTSYINNYSEGFIYVSQYGYSHWDFQPGLIKGVSSKGYGTTERFNYNKDGNFNVYINIGHINISWSLHLCTYIYWWLSISGNIHIKKFVVRKVSESYDNGLITK